MAIILNIDTSGNKGLLALAKDGHIVKSVWNNEPMQHASFVQPAIRQLLDDTGMAIAQIDAIAVSNGPGSYTGLRVGLASAKGLCYALNKPLIALSSLQVLAYSIAGSALENAKSMGNVDINHVNSDSDNKKSLPVLYCAMIDARRMEVFFALYDQDMKDVIAPGTAIVDEHFLHDYLNDYLLVAVGSGADKWRNIISGGKVSFVPEPLLDKALCTLSYNRYVMSKFDSLINIEPYYTKEFYSTNPLHHR